MYYVEVSLVYVEGIGRRVIFVRQRVVIRVQILHLTSEAVRVQSEDEDADFCGICLEKMKVGRI